jgi:DNA-binding beta-propeller fold protein YncE
LQVLWALLISLAVLATSQQHYGHAARLILASTFTMPKEVSGNFDHLAIDTQGKRLFVTPEGYNSVIVFDYTTGNIVHVIRGIGTPHAVLYREGLNRIYVTDGNPGELKIFDGARYQLLKRITLLAHTDSVKYEPRTRYLFIVTGGKEANQTNSIISIADTTSGTIVGRINIDSDALEAMTIDSNAGRLYVSDKAKNRVDVVDLQSRSLIASWPITLGQNSTSLAQDETHHRLFVGCRSGRLIVFDTVSGKEISSLPMTKGVDNMVYDSSTKRLDASCGDDHGIVEVDEQTASGQLVSIAHVPSGPLGKTPLLSTNLHRYFVSVPTHGENAASVLVYDVR